MYISCVNDMLLLNTTTFQYTYMHVLYPFAEQQEGQGKQQDTQGKHQKKDANSAKVQYNM